MFTFEKLFMFRRNGLRAWRSMRDESFGEDPGGGVVAPSEPAAVVSDPLPVADPTFTEPVAPASEPNDVMSALEAAMASEFKDDDPVIADPADVDGQKPAVPEAFQQALSISEYVKTPESVQLAVRAADEVWQVATGAIPARQMLEGFAKTNPQQYQSIVADLKDFLGVTAPQASPLDGLKEANPEAYKQIAEFFQATTGKSLDGAVDPIQAKLSELEQRIGREDRERQESAVQRQIQTADQKGFEFVSSKLKGTYAEGQESFMMPLIAAKIGDRSAAMQEILAGNTATLEKAIRAVTKDLAPVIKAFNANIVKKHNTLAAGVPASKGGAVKSAEQKQMAPLPGETVSQQTARLLKEGLL